MLPLVIPAGCWPESLLLLVPTQVVEAVVCEVGRATSLAKPIQAVVIQLDGPVYIDVRKMAGHARPEFSK